MSPENERRPTGRAPIADLGAALRNGLELARKGRLNERKPSPCEIASEGANHRLRHYFPFGDAFPFGDSPIQAGLEDEDEDEDRIADAGDATQARDAVLLVPPLMMSADLWDIAPESSSVRTLFEAGTDPWVVDFGSPEEEEGGLTRTLTDHVLAVSEAVEAVHEATGQPVHLMGYSQGGMFAYQAAAYRRSEQIASLVTFGTGVDLHGGLPSTIPPELAVAVLERASALQKALIPEGIPSWATRLGFQLMDPIKTLQQRVDFLRQLSDREALEERESVRRFMETEGWTAFPGPALADLLRQLIAQNRMLKGGLVVGGRTVTLADVTCPILAFTGSSDTIAPPDTVRAIYAAAPQAETYEVSVPTGHFGLVVGSKSSDITWPSVIQWLKWCRGEGDLPSTSVRLTEPVESRARSSALDRARDAAALAFDLSAGVLTGTARGLGVRLGQLERLADIVAPQASRLSRLADIRRGTAVSPGLALAERAEQAPEDTFFLFEGRAHSYRDANERIDNIVRGLLSLDVRHGTHVGVLMQTRPSAVASTVALSRLGAVPVLLRPDLPLAEQLALTRVERLLSDPEHAEAARKEFGKDVFVLGGGGEARTLGPGLIDMEGIDPESVTLPDWYQPNPGLAGELALILISGEGAALRTSRVTNRRWATSAYGTSSACALTRQDTVYCRTPIHHPTGMLVCIGGTLTSGARLAMASDFGESIDPGAFWQDVRRYGVNIVFYTGSMCRTLVNAPEDPHERHHSIRLFAGSGMPKSIWHRVSERFAPAGVVEFFASTEGNAVLVNLTGKKVGSLGRPLPGGGEVAAAPWDLASNSLRRERSGFAARDRRGRVALLLERVARERGELDARPLRGVFEANDAWLDTRDLVRVDADGDYWLIDYLADTIHGPNGAVMTIEIENLLCEHLPEIDLAAVYGLRIDAAEEEGTGRPRGDDVPEIVAAAVTLRPGGKLDPIRLRRFVDGKLSTAQQLRVVRVLDSLPMTAGHRPRKRTLREQGLGLDESAGETWWLAPGEEGYVPLEAGDLGKL